MSSHRIIPTPSMAVALTALFLALAGTGYAASQLPHDPASLAAVKHKKQPRACLSTAKALCPGLRAAVDAEVASFVAAHRAALAGPRGLQGAQGPQGLLGPQGAQGGSGAPGPAGPSAQWALVDGNGAIHAQSGGITASFVSTGIIVVTFPSTLEGKTLVATQNKETGESADNRGAIVVEKCDGGTEASTCFNVTNDGKHAVVFSDDQTGALAAYSFYVAAF